MMTWCGHAQSSATDGLVCCKHSIMLQGFPVFTIVKDITPYSSVTATKITGLLYH